MRRIDHVVIAVRDLDQAADVYRRLGFQVGARNRHPWGTENRLIQFASSFIELLTVDIDAQVIPHAPRRFSFGAFVQDFLHKREGAAMLVLNSEDASSDTALFVQQGIGDFEPFRFSRKGMRPDGSETQVAFTLAFAEDPEAPGLSFFVCEQHFPENFWNRDFQQHANTVRDITRITLAASDPKRHQRFLTEFSSAASEDRPGGGIAFRLDAGIIEVSAAEAPNPMDLPETLRSLTVRVDDLNPVRKFIRLEGFDCTDSDEHIVIAPHLLNGVELRFAIAGTEED